MTMKKAYETSVRIFNQIEGNKDDGMLKHIKKLTKKDIIVVKGEYDNIEKLLRQMSFPYTLIDPEDIPKTNSGHVMFVNCMDYDGVLDQSLSKYIKGFVNNGGRLVTTDWALSLITSLFGRLKRTNETSDDVVEIKAVNNLSREFLGLSYTQCHPKWWLENSSYVYKAGQGVTNLYVSEELKRKYGQNNIASAFKYGDGEVFHFISHFDLQRTHQKIKHDYGTLDDFLKKMDAYKTGEMSNVNMAELEAAYSTLNTLAHLCMPYKLLWC